MLNPGGSVKDRIGIAMVEAAEAAGVLKPGGTIVEPTSGNTGVGLAIVAARKGYRCVFVVPDKVSSDKVSLMRAYGAEVVVCPTAVEPEDPRSYYSVSDRLAAEPNAFKPNQYFNQANPQTHVFSTGPELWRQTDGRIDAFVAGVGTGGTVTGVGRYLKDRNPDVTIVGADPEGSLYSGDAVRAVPRRGHRRGLLARDLRPGHRRPLGSGVATPSRSVMARRCAREEGILVGGSCGTALVAAHRYAADQPEDAADRRPAARLRPRLPVEVLRRDLDGRARLHRARPRPPGTVGDVLHAKGDDLPPMVHLHPDETVAAAIALLKEYGVSQMPVFREGVHDDAGVDDILGLDPRERAARRGAARPGRHERTIGRGPAAAAATGDADDPLDHVARRAGQRRHAPCWSATATGSSACSPADLLDTLPAPDPR